MISERPAEAEDRAVPGPLGRRPDHRQDGKSAIGTLVERSTRFVMLLHLPGGHGADAGRGGDDRGDGGAARGQLRRSLTWDQGKEMAGHAQITVATELEIYFCDPHSPWQRGSNENTNGLLRQYFPKGTNLAAHSREHLDAVADRAELPAPQDPGLENPRPGAGGGPGRRRSLTSPGQTRAQRRRLTPPLTPRAGAAQHTGPPLRPQGCCASPAATACGRP